MAESNDNKSTSELSEVISQLAISNKLLETVITNTEVGTLAAIENIGNVIDPKIFEGITKELQNIYGALCIEVTGSINEATVVLDTMNKRVAIIMEDIAHMALVLSETAEENQKFVKSDSKKSDKLEKNTKAISDIDTEEKDLTEKVSDDSARQLEHLLSVLKSAGEGSKKFGQKSIDQFKSIIELLKGGEKKDTVNSLLWNKTSQETSARIGKKLGDMFKKTDDIRKEEKAETSKEMQLELDFGKDAKDTKKLEEEQLKIDKDQLKATISADKKSAISAEDQSQAGEQMQLQGLEDKTESKAPGKSKTSAKFEKVGAMEVGSVMQKALGWIGGFVETVMGVIEVITTIATVVAELFWPIAAAIAIIVAITDFISGFIDGFKDTEGSLGDKIIGGIKQGLLTVLDDLLYLIVDLPKKLISGILSMLGFEDAAKAISDFDLTGIIKDLFGKAFDFFIDFFKELVAAPIEIFYGLYEQLTNMFSGSAGEIAEKIGVFLLDILYLPWTLLKNLAAWVLDKFGFTDIAAKLKEIDIGQMIMDGLLSAVNMIGDFFSGAFEGVKKLWEKVKNFDLIASLKEGLGAIIKTLLEPLPFSGKIIKKAFSILGIEDSGGGDSTKPESASKDSATSSEVTPSPEAKAAALSAPENKISALETPNNSGATMNAMQSDTQDANSAAQDAPVVVPGGSGGGGGTNNTTVSSVSYASNNVPDRTAWQMAPAFGF